MVRVPARVGKFGGFEGDAEVVGAHLSFVGFVADGDGGRFAVGWLRELLRKLRRRCWRG